MSTTVTINIELDDDCEEGDVTLVRVTAVGAVEGAVEALEDFCAGSITVSHETNDN